MTSPVELVRNALWDAWFPGGHGYELQEDPRFQQDFESWKEISLLDAEVAVGALVKAGLICIADDNVYDGDKSQDK